MAFGQRTLDSQPPEQLKVARVDEKQLLVDTKKLAEDVAYIKGLTQGLVNLVNGLGRP